MIKSNATHYLYKNSKILKYIMRRKKFSTKLESSRKLRFLKTFYRLKLFLSRPLIEIIKLINTDYQKK